MTLLGGSFVDIANNGSGLPVIPASPGTGRLVLANAPRVPTLSQNGGAIVNIMGVPLSWGANAPASLSFFGHWSFAQNAAELGTRVPMPFTGAIFRLSVRALDATWSAAARSFAIRANGVQQFATSNTALGGNLVGNNATAIVLARGTALSIQLLGGALTNRIWATVYVVPTG